ncbi:23S rRNA (pseudouridine(1915)-N(3))-methyltransferase RlmH [Candidatus Saccharibacteria bacterium]|nr:23S rRNA (pseudouridine(1915)-N(3))-methyltransferase RlmH [Candidatus Saccharibacteria bacterium]
MIRIITIGKRHTPELAALIQDYEKRLRPPFTLTWTLLPNSPNTNPTSDESKQILTKITPSDFVILLDETGKNLSSPELSQLLTAQINNSKQITLIIGGAYGVSPEIKQRANFIWSLSNLVFPHQIVRLILTEQIYRAQTITQNHPYHHT